MPCGCRFAITLVLLLWAPSSFAHGVLKLTNGLWYNGSGFEEREFYAVEGILRESYEGDFTVVDLEGAHVVPGFGNAHTHGIGSGDFAAENDRFLGRGVLYVANPNSITSRTPSTRERASSENTVDVRLSNGGLTSSGGHPIQIFEPSRERSSLDGDAYFIVDDASQLDERWSEILGGKPDFLKVYLERAEHHARRKDDPDYYGRRGLDPQLIAAIVDRAAAAGLRVAAHVTSRFDFVTAVEAGVREIAHLPLERLQKQDAELAAARGTVVVTTVLSHRPSPESTTWMRCIATTSRCCTTPESRWSWVPTVRPRSWTKSTSSRPSVYWIERSWCACSCTIRRGGSFRAGPSASSRPVPRRASCCSMATRMKTSPPSSVY